MIRLLRAPDLLTGQHWVNLLRQARIACSLQHVYLQGALGEIPPDQCGSEVWLENPEDRDAALRLIEQSRNPPPAARPHWYCETCQEWLEPQFSVCWQCGADREDQARL
ncbi:DUF2007 domain-containing protein [Pigmentiphaga soli]|uniref:DUF2007 domain-containing protein n=1 Tax=Pigmentiphaga soli TaxID=1007095 RepID=A0ABP8GCF7_9BURK